MAEEEKVDEKAENTEKPAEEEPLTPEEAEAAESKAKKVKKIAIITIPIIIALLGSGFFYFRVIKAPKMDAAIEHPVPASTPENIAMLDKNTYLDLDPMTIALSPSGPKREYLRIDLAIRLGSEKESAAVFAKMPIIKDTLVSFLRSLRATDFNSSSSTIFLKEEILKRISKITAPIVIKEVLFQEITIN